MEQPISAPAAVEPTAPAAPVAPAASVEKPGVFAVVGSLLASASKKFDAAAVNAALKAQNEKLTADLASSQSALKAASEQLSAEIAAHRATAKEFEAVAGFFGLNVSDLAGKDAVACHALVRSKIDSAALDAIAGMGIDSAALPKAATEPAKAKADPALTGRARYTADFNRQLAANFGRN